MGGQGAPTAGSTAARTLGVAALVLATVLVAVILLRSGSGGYETHAVFENASQIVKGNLVKVGGRSVGKVKEIKLDDRNRAILTLSIEDELAPLHVGTTATIRATSLSGVANRYVALSPGPNSSPQIADGGRIGAEDTQSAVDLDQLLNTLDMDTRDALGRIVRGSAVQYDGAEKQANAALVRLNPALAQTAHTTRELVHDSSALERFIVESAAVVGAVSSRDVELEDGIVNAAAVADAIARERASLDTTLALAPDVLRRANTTLVNARASLIDLRPALREAQPVAPRLARLLRLLDPLSQAAVPVVADLRGLAPELTRTLRGLPRLDRSARPAVTSAATAIEGAAPVVAGLRPYVPDVVAGLLNGFGGATGGYYDANGHYARIAFQGGPYQFGQGGSLIPTPPGDGAIFDFRKGIAARCPGGATQSAPDGSNPFTPPEAPCKPEDSPR